MTTPATSALAEALSDADIGSFWKSSPAGDYGELDEGDYEYPRLAEYVLTLMPDHILVKREDWERLNAALEIIANAKRVDPGEGYSISVSAHNIARAALASMQPDAAKEPKP